MPGSPRSVLVIGLLCCGLSLVVAGGLRFRDDRGTALWLLGGALMLVVLSILLTGARREDG